jgi:excisionase family DNA binding protein
MAAKYAELVTLGVGEHHPPGPVGVPPVVDLYRAESDQPRQFLIAGALSRSQVEVDPVLDLFPLGNLEEQQAVLSAPVLLIAADPRNGTAVASRSASLTLGTVKEAAERLNTSERFPRRLIEERRIVFVHIGRNVRIPEAPRACSRRHLLDGGAADEPQVPSDLAA